MVSIFSDWRLQFLLGLVAVAILLAGVLTIIERGVRKRRQEELRLRAENSFIEEIRRRANLSRSPRESLDFIDSVAKKYFSENFGVPINSDYAFLMKKFGEEGMKDLQEFCSMMFSAYYLKGVSDMGTIKKIFDKFIFSFKMRGSRGVESKDQVSDTKTSGSQDYKGADSKDRKPGLDYFEKGISYEKGGKGAFSKIEVSEALKKEEVKEDGFFEKISSFFRDRALKRKERKEEKRLRKLRVARIKEREKLLARHKERELQKAELFKERKREVKKVYDEVPEIAAAPGKKVPEIAAAPGKIDKSAGLENKGELGPVGERSEWLKSLRKRRVEEASIHPAGSSEWLRDIRRELNIK